MVVDLKNPLTQDERDAAARNGSRKYKLALIAMVLVTGGWVTGGFLPGLGQMFSELITGIMGVLMLYFTGNVGNKFVVGRHIVEQAKVTAKKGEPNGTE